MNLEQMKSEEMDYITRLSASTLQALIKGLPEDNQPEFWDRDQLIELEINGLRYVIAGSEFRQQRDYERRNVRITKGINALTQIAAVKRKQIDVQNYPARLDVSC